MYEINFLSKTENDKKIEDVLRGFEVKITNKNPMFKINLAYPIKGHEIAWMGEIMFEIEDGDNLINKITNKINLDDEILRYVIIRKDKKEDNKKTYSKEGEFPTMRRVPTRIKKENILTNEALEKKIEEILK